MKPYLHAAASLALVATGCASDTTVELASDLACGNCTLDEQGRALFDFGVVAVGASAERPIVLVNRGSAPMKVAAPALGAPFVLLDRADVTVPAGGTLEVLLSYQPTEAGTHEAVAAFAAQDSVPLTIVLRGTGAFLDVACEPARLRFGRVVLESHRDLPATCTNRSELLAATVRLSIDGDDAYSVRAPDTLALAPLQSVEIPLRLAPRTPGKIEAKFLATSLDGQHALSTVRLEGEGIDSGLRIEPGPGAGGCYDVGHVPPGRTKVVDLAALNVGNVPVTVSSTEVIPSSAPFRLEPSEGFVVPGAEPGEVPQQPLQLVFEPPGLGAFQARVRIHSDDRNNELLELCVKGWGGGPVLHCTPERIAVLAAVGTPRTQTVHCSNIGTEVPHDPDALLKVEALVAPSPFVAAEDFPGAAHAPGETFAIRVTYDPQEAGSHAGELAIETTGGDATVLLAGEAISLPPCEFALFPDDGLEFGVLDRDEPFTRTQVLRNEGTSDCLITDVGTSGPSGKLYEVPEELKDPQLVPPGELLEIPVTFVGTVPGTYVAQLDFRPNGYDSLAVPLNAVSHERCLELAVQDASFGTVFPGCTSPTRYLQIFNGCRTKMTLTGVEIPAGFSDEFEILEVPGTPYEIPSGAIAEVLVAYRPRNEGPDQALWYVHIAELARPVIGKLHGNGGDPGVQVDEFRGIGRSSIDILWVIDSSGSMGPHQEAIAKNIAPFLDVAIERKVDFRMGVTTTSVGSSEDGRLFPVNGARPRILHAKMKRDQLVADWGQNIRVGTSGSGNEKGLEAARRALTPPVINNLDDPRHPEPEDGNRGFLRRDANLALIFVSDARDQSTELGTEPKYWENYLTIFRNVIGERRSHFALRAHTINAAANDETPTCSAEGPGLGYNDVAAATGGKRGSLCAADWNDVLHAIADGAFSIERCFTLHGQPGPATGETSDDPEDWLEVRINGVLAPRTLPSGFRRWRYDVENNDICFEPLYGPGPADVMHVAYTVSCGF